MNIKQLSAVATRARKQMCRKASLRGLSIVLAIAAVLVAATGCGGSGSLPSGSRDTTTLRIAVSSSTPMNPAKSTYAVYWGAMGTNPAYAALFHVTTDGEIKPQLATEWGYVNTAERKNEVFEFTLRDDAEFSDGTPVNAQAVVGWLEYFVQAKGLYANVLGSEPKFTATGPHTVRIELSAPNPRLPEILSDQGSAIGLIGSPAAVADPELMESGTYGAGPYKLLPSETVNNDHYTYVPNTSYWDQDAIHFEKINVKVIANASTRLQAQQSGEYDVTIGDPSTASQAAGLQVASAPQGVFYLSFDTKHDVGAPALRDVRVRQAMNYAIDREGIAKALFGETADPAYGYVTQDLDTASHNFRYEYDPAKAKQLLAEAGYADGLTLNGIDTGTFLGQFGTPLVSAVAENLKAVGIKLDSQSSPNQADYAKKVFEYKAAVVQTLGVISTTPPIYTQNLAPDGTTNFFGEDKEITRLYEAGVSSDDPDAAWGEMWQRYTNQAYTIPLVTYPALYYVSKGISGVDVSAAAPSSLPTAWYPADKQQ